MRTDVKLGIVTSMVVVLVAGGYFLFRGDSQTPIPIADKSSPAAPKTAAKPPAAKQPATNPSRPVNSSKDASARPNPPVTPGNRDLKVVTKPADRSPVAPPKERSPVTQPVAEPVAGATTVPSRSPTVTEPTLERSLTSPAMTSAPVSPAPVAAGSPESTYASRTLMAGNEPPRPAPTTPVESPTLGSPTAASPAAASKAQPSGSPSEAKPELHKAAVDTHRVQPGDSFASLAQTYYGNAKHAKFLAESNPGIPDPAKLALGQTVKIPALPADIDAKIANAAPTKIPPAATTTVAGKRTYKVKPGDSFYRIAKDQLGNAERWKELLALNKAVVHGDPTQLQPGQTLVLPDS